MRSILVLILLVLFSVTKAATYYVATNGSDSNPGTINSPFGTWQKGFTMAQPGDIVYIRGGNYYPKGVWADDVYSGVFISNKNGTSGKMISILAYPGEIPVLDCKDMTQPESHMGVFLIDCDYWHLKGLTIRNCIQTPGFGAHGLYLKSGNYNKFEQIDISFIGGSGLSILYNSEKNYIYNCDVHDCFDQYTKNENGTSNAGEHADGIDLADITERQGNERVNTLRGVRCWNNADDGFDHYRVDGILIIDSCWVWHNGYNYGGNTPTGDGNGFKLGKTDGKPENSFQRTVTNCIAYDNRQRGFSQENANVNMKLYNNIAYKNKLQGFAFVAHNRPDILKNNISYRNSANGSFQSKQAHNNNSWDSGVTISDEDFVSLDGTQLGAPRKANGSLPDITFLALAPGSDMIDKGVDVGTPYAGKLPDMGPFEVTGTTSVTPKDSVLFVSSVIEDDKPDVLQVTYNSTLTNILPAPTAFTVNVNSAARTVSSLSISGTKLLLTIANPVSFGDIITVAYKKPASNSLQNTAGKIATDLPAKPVANLVSDQSITGVTSLDDAIVENIIPQKAPEYLRAVIENGTPNILEITYSEDLADTVPGRAAFIVKVNGTSQQVTEVSITGMKVSLLLNNYVESGDDVTIAYVRPASNPLQAIAGENVFTFSDKNVTNNITEKEIINVYPNPATKYINISSPEPTGEPSLVRIFDFSGKLCQESRVNGGERIPVNLKSGMYIVQIIDLASVVIYAQNLIVR